MTISLPFENSFSNLPDQFFARLDPTPVSAPSLITVNHKLAARLGIDSQDLETSDGVAILSGNAVAAGSEPLAQVYAGHQFGGWSPRLGDGRAHLIGEVVAPDRERFDIQLKGSGPTPFSRGGDGRAWLGPVLREYIVSEAMYALGVPTTRALAAVATGDTVFREGGKPGAILTRVASSHIRVGSFQYFAAQQDTDALRTLLEYAIQRHHPDAASAEDPAMAFFAGVISRQANLVAHWMSLGFIHGVLNTDNTTVSGETIDYGPCAFIDDFHPDKVFSSIDRHGRYAYRNQPDILIWNLAQLGGAILPLMSGDSDDAAERATAELRKFPEIFESAWLEVFRRKLGLAGQESADKELAQGFLNLLTKASADFTNSFRGLINGQTGLEGSAGWDDWERLWTARRNRGADDEAAQSTNPAVIPRNHQIESMISAAVAGDFQPFFELNRVLENPFDLAERDAHFASPPKPDEIVAATFCGT